MTAPLQRCRFIWGSCERIAAVPRLSVVTDADYLPAGAGAPWALRAADGRIIEAGGDPEALPPSRQQAAAPTAEYLYIGPLITHYGHFLIGTLARLWPLLSWQGPPPTLLCHAAGPQSDWAGLDVLTATLDRFGLTAADIVAFDRPLRLGRVAIPELSLKEQTFVHDVHGALCREIGRPFWHAAEVDEAAQPVYLSKDRLTSGIARMQGEAALCEALARRGVAIVHPETLRSGEQVRLFSRHRIVLGSVGSAFHTAAFAAPGRRVIGLNFAAHLKANFPLLDGLKGTQAKYYHPAGSQSGPEPGFQFGWSLPDPDGVAEELLARAARFERLDAEDAAADAARRRASESLIRRLRRLLVRPVRAAARRLRNASGSAGPQ
ncbi:hypothetical protein OCOJLMKI_1380 [Methylobacterium iners]|uniref:Glycosyltransferase 61 catalytic domain-containing protein n=1 Tax=Methylobacterium iners TaxID=418707 RepID=A0ABQ4RTQ6_9HYPH|nr:hypothetical protein OCOJLMKI_1380 [Methylobacterium iners]